MRALPPQLRMWMTGQVQMFCADVPARGLQRKHEDEEGEVIGGAVFQQLLQKAPALINELDEVLCGVAIAADGKSAHLDCRLTADSRHGNRAEIRPPEGHDHGCWPVSACRRPP